MSFPLILAGGARSPQIQRSLRFRASASAYMVRPRTTSNTTTTFTLHFAVKLGLVDANNRMLAYGYFDANNYSYLSMSAGVLLLVTVVAGTSYILTVGATHRDSSGFLFVTVGVDTTQAVAANRVAFDVNGKIIPHTGTAMPQNLGMTLTNQGSDQFLGSNQAGTSTSFFDGYMARHCCVNGSKLASTYFLNFNSLTRTFEAKSDDAVKGLVDNGGLGGYYLTFTDTTSLSTLGTDKSSKGNNWTPVNFSLAGGASYDSMLDVPLGGGGGGRGNYCTLNPAFMQGGAIKDGNLRLGPGNVRAGGTLGISSGKWVWWAQTDHPTFVMSSGLIKPGAANAEVLGFGDALSWGWYANSGQKWFNSSNTAWGSAFTSTSDVARFEFDADLGQLSVFKNGVLQGGGPMFTGLTDGPYFPAIQNNDGTYLAYINFGQRPPPDTPTAGFKTLHTGNFPEPLVGRPTDCVVALSRAGNGTNGYTFQDSSLVKFTPKMTDTKRRDASSSHIKFNALTSRNLSTNLSNGGALASAYNNGGVTALVPGGFTFGIGSTDIANVNASGGAYVDILTRGGASIVANTAGTITSQVCVDSQAGIALITYVGNGVSGATVGHGLGAAPDTFETKSESSGVGNWGYYHKVLGATKVMNTNGPGAAVTTAAAWNNTAPTSLVMSLGSGNDVNAAGVTYFAVARVAVKGFSAFGFWTGNADGNGPYSDLGFSPQTLRMKRSDALSGWYTWDTARNPSNPVSNTLYPHNADAENASTSPVDFLVSGVKVRAGPSTGINDGGGTYVYEAYAAVPTKYALAR